MSTRCPLVAHWLPTNCTQRLADACNCLLLVAHRLHPNITINISINDGNAAAHRASRCYPGCMCRSYFGSKAVYFAIRPMCRKRSLRVSGGQCGPACAMWCFFIEQAGVDEPKPYFLPCKKKKPGSFHHPAICTALYCLCLRHGCKPISLRPHARGQQ